MKVAITIAVFLVSLLGGGLYVYSQRNTRNDFYEYCTTRAYGLPFPWRIDYCECDGRGGLTEFPLDSKIWNASAVLVFAVVFAGSSHLLLRRLR